MFIRIILILSLVLYITGCSGESSYYIVGTGEEQRIIRELFHLLSEERGSSEEKLDNRFILIKLISEILYNAGYPEKQITFLTQYAEKNSKDPYNAFYLAMAAETYKERGDIPFALHYYERILRNYPDVFVVGNSIHLECLNELLKYTDNSEYRIEYYKELISRFGNEIDLGKCYYYLAESYEDTGEWDLSIQTYKQFLNYPETMIPDNANAYEEVSNKVSFYDVEKDWVVEDLKFLVSEIKNALSTKNVAKLNEYKAKINFFSKYWLQKDYDAQRIEKIFSVGNMLLSSRNIKYNTDLEPDSNSNEAYLKTWGWSYMIGTWYLYFRRIDFPEDPEVDGKWEWAGIYFGNKS
jgi:tetratricopeptide (TPR) repeat protein